MPRPNKDFELGQQISRLQGIVEAGFKGVHQRQDITNGRIGKAEERIEKIEKSDTYLAGQRKGISKVFAFLLTVAGLIIGLLAAGYHL